MTADAVVIGAGHNGLVAGAYLARAGLRVVIVERRRAPGGCAATEELWPGYQVDTGAHSLVAIDSRVARDLRLADAGAEFLSPDPCMVSPQEGGGALILGHDAARTASCIRRFSERDAARWPEFLAAMSRAARTLSALYATLPPKLAVPGRGEVGELLRLAVRLGRTGRRDAVELLRLIPMSVDELLGEWFGSDAVKGTLAATAIRGICQGPMAPGTAYMFLHQMAGADGVVGRRRQLRGGMRTLGETLQRVAEAAGAEIRLGRSVKSVTVDDDGRATGIELASGKRIAARYVISGADPGQTLLGMVDSGELAPEFSRALTNIRYRGVCAKVHLALARAPRLRGVDGSGADAASPCGSGAAEEAVLAGAALTIAPSIEYVERAYDDAKYGRPSESPVIDAVLTTALDPGLAPESRHVLSALVQYAPFSLADGQWNEAREEALGDAVVSALAAYAPELPDLIVHRHVLGPAGLASRFALPEGNIYHGEMTLDQVFFGRPLAGWARYRTPVENLYLCSAGTHPGGGLDGRPGAAAAARILRDHKRGRRRNR